MSVSELPELRLDRTTIPRDHTDHSRKAPRTQGPRIERPEVTVDEASFSDDAHCFDRTGPRAAGNPDLKR
jgi:hypothetical protein